MAPELSTGSQKDIDVAVAAARKAFNTTWGKNVTGFERSRLLNKLADLMERDQQVLAEVESLNNGKPVTIARSGPTTWLHKPADAPSEIRTLVTVFNVCGTMLDGQTRLWARQVSSAPTASGGHLRLLVRLSKLTTKPRWHSQSMSQSASVDRCR